MSFCSNIKYRIITAGIQTPSERNFRIVCYIFIVVAARENSSLFFIHSTMICFLLHSSNPTLSLLLSWRVQTVGHNFIRIARFSFVIVFFFIDFDLDNSNLIFSIYSIKFNVWYIYESIYIWHSVVLQSGKYQCLVQWMKYGSVRYSMYIYVCVQLLNRLYGLSLVQELTLNYGWINS